MPLIDMSDVLNDPMFLDNFTVNRRAQSIDDTGVASTTVTTTPNVAGVVYPSSDNELKRLPDADITAKTITIVTLFALRGESQVAGTQYKPDVVVWNGDSFLVRNVEDYSNYGAGFISAICTSIDSVDQPPAG